MSLIKCKECGKEISDQATMCPYCGCPTGQMRKTLVQIDTAPKKRRKYRVRFLIFAPMFFLGVLFTMGSIASGEGGKLAFWFITGLVGFIGMVVSAIGSWLAEP